MDTQRLVPLRSYLFFGLGLLGIGMAGLFLIFRFTLPTLGPRWLFFFLFMLMVTGVILPLAAFLNRRFPSNPPADSGIILREALWFGIAGCLMAWLQTGRVLTSMRGMFIIMAFVVIEILLRMREHSQFKPQSSEDESE